MATDALATYLNDHLAGSTAALQLVDHLVETCTNSDERKFLTTLRDEIAEDRATLEDLIRRTGERPSALRDLGGWLAEKAGRLKLKLDDPASDKLKALEAFEILALGIYGKLSLWRALVLVAPAMPQWGHVDFSRLERRAEQQHAQLETRRLEAVRRLLIAET